MDIKDRVLKYDEFDEHILRRLGGAVVVLWDDLPTKQRRRILDQAILMGDRYQTVQLKQQIEIFIRAHKASS
jgi:hypothetical protein